MKDTQINNSDDVICIEHLAKTFGDHEVLKDINIHIQKNEVICIIGSSGSGKSTLLRCINHLETPTKGNIYYHGSVVHTGKRDLEEYRIHVGMVFQSFNLFENMSVMDNCTIALRKVLKMNEKDEKNRKSG